LDGTEVLGGVPGSVKWMVLGRKSEAIKTVMLGELHGGRAEASRGRKWVLGKPARAGSYGSVSEKGTEYLLLAWFSRVHGEFEVVGAG